ncbi:aldehyde dehydrogenase family protein [Streptomyces sp. NBC_01361]|uniref:aldehyde dehydrogenase family protein n=1 Tax=Streptomyces sp. NBC_01361 TaxID=2903838 RepID=UPI002E37F810|nr:aldehyde dehydrogenase family protein [Streptomyces sp. NBC_01361]
MGINHATLPTPTTRGVALPSWLTPVRIEQLAARLTAAADAERVTTNAPYTGAPLADLLVSTPTDVEDAFARARIAQKSWASISLSQRKKILLRFHDLVLARQDEVLDLMQAENGKTRRDAFLEVTDIAITSRYYARNAAKYLEPKRRRGAIPVLTHTTELRHPKGVVAVVSPWNYPLSMAAGDAIPALIAGNAVVQKPDTQTALSALWALDLMHEAGLPAGVWQMVVGRGSSIGGTLMDNADFMMFTGSTASGRKIASDAGQRLIGASLELGGKNAMIVLDDADIDKAADGAIAACFPSAGQLCVSIERLYVAESIRDQFVAAFVARAKQLKIGAAFAETPQPHRAPRIEAATPAFRVNHGLPPAGDRTGPRRPRCPLASGPYRHAEVVSRAAVSATAKDQAPLAFHTVLDHIRTFIPITRIPSKSTCRPVDP